MYRPQTEIFHACITIDRKLVNLSQHLSFIQKNNVRKRKTDENGKEVAGLPITDFNIMKIFVDTLRNNFGRYGLFLYDEFGGFQVFVMWKPGIFESKPIVLNFTIDDCKITDTSAPDGRANVTLNLEAILEDIRILGKGIIKDIHLNMEENMEDARK